MRLRAALSLAGLLACLATGGARAENWFRNLDACMDMDSVRLITGAKLPDALVSYRGAACKKNGQPDGETYRLAVKRQECPAIINGATSFTYFMYIAKEDHWREDVAGYLKGPALRGLALIACRKKGAPDGMVVFENHMSDDGAIAIVYIDGAQACRLDSFLGSDCDVDLRRYGGDPERRHAVRIVAGQRQVNDTVSVSDCHWNWQGTKVFEISDNRVHFDCMQ